MIAYQACPVCGGQKYVNKPPYIAGDQSNWVACNTGGYACPVCHGAGLLPVRVAREEDT